ncbi:MAG: peroxidase family protein [Pseudomonadota bacterium]
MKRDTSRDGFINTIQSTALKRFRPLWSFLQSVPFLERLVNRLIINNAMSKAVNRPHAFSTLSNYTSWRSLMDKTYFGRRAPATEIPNLPDAQDVAALFRIPESGPTLSPKSTMLFPVFAQWFTDGFLLTDDEDRRRTRTSHQIDLNQIYGYTEHHTTLVRLHDPHRKGRLKSVESTEGEFAPRLFDEDGNLKPEFEGLPLPSRLSDDTPLEQKRTIFAFAGERSNSTPFTAAMTTLFLREHNRIADNIAAQEPSWDDDRVFEVSRNTMIAMLIKVVIEEYINHIAPYHFRLRAFPQFVWEAKWNRPNWIPVEFNLLYRWHSLVPSEVTVAQQQYPSATLLLNNQLLIEHGVQEMLAAASANRAWRLGLANTAKFLLPVELATILQGRETQVASYNTYRTAMSYPTVTDFNQITGDETRINALKAVYSSVDQIEFYVGLMAEDAPVESAVPPMIGRMVALDAFSHALTNPLLSVNVFNERTFSALGWKTINETFSLADIVKRNTSSSQSAPITMDWPKGSTH